MTVRSTWVSRVRACFTLAILALLSGSCENVARVIEGPPTTDARLVVALTQSRFTLTKPGEQVITATVTTSGDYSGNVPLTISGVPTGVTASFSGSTLSGRTITNTLTLGVASSAAPGTYVLIVHAHVDGIPDASAEIALTVAEPASFTVTPARATFNLIRGGIADTKVAIARVNLSSPVSLSVDGVAGITSAYVASPTAPDSGVLTISVGAAVAPGTYAVSLRGVAEGATAQSVPLTIAVSADALQLVAAASATSAQGASASIDLIVNHTSANPVTLSVDNTPAGITATFQPASVSGNRSSLTLAVDPATAVSTPTITIRAKSAGAADVTTTLALGVLEAAITAVANPSSISLFPGASASTTITVARTNFTGAVVIAAENTPAGLTVTPSSASVTGGTAAIAVAAGTSTVPGAYSVTLRATPAGFPASASKAITIAVNVSAQAVGGGNVILDWSTCTTPEWIAAQDGNGSWKQVLPVNGTAQFSVTAATGAFAYASASTGVTVRYYTHDELTAQPFNLCPDAATKTIKGTGNFTNSPVVISYSLGGATTSANGINPAFVLTPVRDGAQDFIAWGTTRAVIRRDVDIANNGTVGTIDLVSDESFATDRASITTIGPSLAGEAITYNMAFLTTPACIVNPVYAGSFGSVNGGGNLNFSVSLPVVPSTYLRSTDYHLYTELLTSASGLRSTSLAFRTGSASIGLPPIFNAPVTTVLSGSYLRLQTVIASIPGSYNNGVALSYGGTQMNIAATAAYAGSANVTLAMPEFSGVSGWKSSFATPAGSTGSWTVTVTGSTSPGPQCQDRRSSFRAAQFGSY